MLIFLLSALIPGWLNAGNVLQRQKKDLDILNKLVALLRWLRFNRWKEQGQTFSRWKNGQLAQLLKLRKGEKHGNRTGHREQHSPTTTKILAWRYERSHCRRDCRCRGKTASRRVCWGF